MDMEIEAAREEGRKQGRTARPGAIHRNLAEKLRRTLEEAGTEEVRKSGGSYPTTL